MVKGRTTLIALAAAMLIPGAARHAHADQTHEAPQVLPQDQVHALAVKGGDTVLWGWGWGGVGGGGSGVEVGIRGR